MNTYHIPVLLDEVVAGLNIQVGKKYIDATVGGAGHAWEIVKRGGIVLGIDTDQEAVTFANEKLKREGETKQNVGMWKVIQGNFRDIESIAVREGFNQVDGILFDLGVSSHQLDEGSRGFSYRFTGAPLDLRLNQGSGEDAKDVLKRLNEEELYEIFAKFGEEERSRAIAHALVRARSVKPIETIGDVVRVIGEIVPDERERNGILSRVLQALRIVVNDEMEALRAGLAGAQHLLANGGRLVVVSFHSLEDRVVKQFLAGEHWQPITKKPIIADYKEIYRNRRSRSAKLRIAVKI